MESNMSEQQMLWESIKLSCAETKVNEQSKLERQFRPNGKSTKTNKPTNASSQNSSRILSLDDGMQDDFCDPSVQTYAVFYRHRIWRDIPRYEWSLPDGSCLFDSLRMCLHANGSSLNVKTSKQFRKLVLQVAKGYLKSGEPVESTGADMRNMITHIRGMTIDESVEYWFNTMKGHTVPGDSTCISIVSKKCNAIIIVQEETCNGELIANHIYQAHGVNDDETRLYLRLRVGHYVPILGQALERETQLERHTVVEQQYNTENDEAIARAMAGVQVSEEEKPRVHTRKTASQSSRITTNRELRANAAEKRITNDPLSDHRVKQELIGKLEGMYKLRNLEIPFGLRSLSVHQLKLRIQAMKK
jgi:hypothetical protein